MINMTSDHFVSSNNSFKSHLNAKGGLQHVFNTVAVVRSTLILLQCLLQGWCEFSSWRKLKKPSSWTIPLFLIKNSFGSSFKFHSNLFFKRNKVKFFPSFYKEFFLYWKKYLTRKPEIPSCILSQYLWYNENIQVDKN